MPFIAFLLMHFPDVFGGVLIAPSRSECIRLGPHDQLY